MCSFPAPYLSVRRRSSALERVSSVHRGVTPRDILVCVISKMQKVRKMITEVLPRHVHAHSRKRWFGMMMFQKMLPMREWKVGVKNRCFIYISQENHDERHMQPFKITKTQNGMWRIKPQIGYNVEKNLYTLWHTSMWLYGGNDGTIKWILTQ